MTSRIRITVLAVAVIFFAIVVLGSPFSFDTKSTCDSGHTGDLNRDGVVDSDDLNYVRTYWGQSVTPCQSADASGDGFVNAEDLNVIRINWGNYYELEPRAELLNLPENPSSDITLNVQVEGTNVFEYQYAVIFDDTISCENADYSDFRSVDFPIIHSVGPAGRKVLCVRGRDESRQAQNTATSYEWESYLDPVQYNVLPIERRLMGDLNADGSVDDSDIELLQAVVKRGSEHGPTLMIADIDESGYVDLNDIESLMVYMQEDAFPMYSPLKYSTDYCPHSIDITDDLMQPTSKAPTSSKASSPKSGSGTFLEGYINVDWSWLADASYNHDRAAYGVLYTNKGLTNQTYTKLGKDTLSNQCGQPDAGTSFEWKVPWNTRVLSGKNGTMTLQVFIEGNLKILDTENCPPNGKVEKNDQMASCTASFCDFEYQDRPFTVKVGSKNNKCNFMPYGKILTTTPSNHLEICPFPQCNDPSTLHCCVGFYEPVNPNVDCSSLTTPGKCALNGNCFWKNGSCRTITEELLENYLPDSCDRKYTFPMSKCHDMYRARLPEYDAIRSALNRDCDRVDIHLIAHGFIGAASDMADYAKWAVCSAPNATCINVRHWGCNVFHDHANALAAAERLAEDLRNRNAKNVKIVLTANQRESRISFDDVSVCDKVLRRSQTPYTIWVTHGEDGSCIECDQSLIRPGDYED